LAAALLACGFLLAFLFALVAYLSFRYVCDRAWLERVPYAAASPTLLTATLALSLHAFLTQPLSSLDARSVPGVFRQRYGSYAPINKHS
jgi:hypothetical protein